MTGGHSKSGHAPPRRSARHMLLFATPQKRTWWIFASVVAAIVVAVAAVLLLTDLDWDTVQRGIARVNTAMERLHASAVIPLMAILPILGFPIGLVYLVAGARFGALQGGAIVTLVTAIHLVGSYYIGRSFLRRPIERFIEKRHHHLPQVPDDEQLLVCVIAALVPGLPYFVRNYLLVLAGVRLKIMFWVCLPIYVARSYATILLGDLSGDPSRRGLVILLGVDGLKLAICAFVIWRLREHHRKFHPTGDHPGGDVAVPPSGAGR